MEPSIEPSMTSSLKPSLKPSLGYHNIESTMIPTSYKKKKHIIISLVIGILAGFFFMCLLILFLRCQRKETEKKEVELIL
jgi:hypothetical protein